MNDYCLSSQVSEGCRQ